MLTIDIPASAVGPAHMGHSAASRARLGETEDEPNWDGAAASAGMQ